MKAIFERGEIAIIGKNFCFAFYLFDKSLPVSVRSYGDCIGYKLHYSVIASFLCVEIMLGTCNCKWCRED